MSDVTSGIQLYTLRDFIQTYEDFDETLAYLKAIGVSDIQISGIGDIPAQQQAELLEKYEMNVCCTHKSFDLMTTALDKLIDDHDVINCDCIGLGGMPSIYRDSLEGVKQFISIASDIAVRMRERGKRFAYHNHDFEFTKIDGDKTIFDILIEQTDPDVFWFIPDVCWIQIGGEDPAEYLKRLKGRVKVVHFKDFAYIDEEKTSRRFVTLGDGLVDLKACYNACKELDFPFAMYEQDCDWDDNDPKSCCEKSYNYMLSLDDSTL